ncbi:4Fe-4S dicluster domain-containing protein [Halodesulfovibrio marinisediminis]|uniref:Reductive dehalogenase n=1 Tax=Halodesulfovibrio marinisediminis DSM 17456 TaxID=1121457 RepID=A0A1N6E9K6_9BACT|nr:4Fe-4S dicluster domain-containing protein [Halodesulfovibrio marinisediminis]SIN79729.1 reductive dehalogenase [Halodesulfovibrio marinisediminis DSM 17456]
MSNEQNPMDIINDPKNFTSTPYGEEETLEESVESNEPEPSQKKKKGVSRRNFLKYGGATAAAATVAGAGGAGFAIGRSDDAYTGYGRTYQGGDMFFNREPFRTDVPAMMTPVGKVERPEWTEYLFLRLAALVKIIKSGEWTPDMGVDKLPGPVGDHYRARPGDLEIMLESLQRNIKRAEAWEKEKHKRYALAGAYTGALRFGGMEHADHTNRLPEDPHDEHMRSGKPVPPEDWDYRGIWRDKPMEFKSPKHASQLIKRMAHQFGMSLVGIAKFDPRFMFKGLMRGMPNKGHDSWGDKVPEHWKSIIVFGVPMNWDGTYSAVGYSTSFDAYFRSRCAASLMERFIKELGYPARAQFPGHNYEIMMSPYVQLAGLGQYSRAGMVMVPELGANFRPAAVITNIEFEYDKPIDVKMADFCKKCKICAENCPSGAITFDDEPKTVVRGFKRWKLNEEKCYQQWASGTTQFGLGCRVCIGVCPYSRKNTWIHTISRELEPRDPTGLVATGLLAMQKNFFKFHEAEDYRSDWNGGKEANYHNPPWWLRTENFLKVEKTWDYHGME